MIALIWHLVWFRYHRKKIKHHQALVMVDEAQSHHHEVAVYNSSPGPWRTACASIMRDEGSELFARPASLLETP